MSVLGHTSVSMSLVYAQIGDPEVLADYQAVLGPDVTTAGPSASALRNHDLPPDAVHWLKANFFRTELEEVAQGWRARRAAAKPQARRD